MTTPAAARPEDETDVAVEEGPFAVGEMIGESYRIVSVLGRGGMGVVYEAEDILCRRKVAIKATAWAGGEQLLRWEAQAAAAIRHPGLPTVHYLGTHHKVPYLVMERLHGVNLEQHLAQTGRLDIVPALGILIPLAETLAALHDNGLAHRDIKPANIMLCPNGRVVLVDFGIMMPEVEVPAADLQAPCGTPTYMAPEAIAGTIKTGQANLLDIYGFGVVAHEILTGEPPFPSDNFLVVLQQHLSIEPPRLSSVLEGTPVALDDIIFNCLAKDPIARPSIGTVMWELGGLTRSLRGNGPRSVLIVDDDPDAIELLTAYTTLRIPAPRVRSVATCESALWQARRAPPDLMLVDMSLPGMSGLELCGLLHSAGITKRTTVVAVSALQEDWIVDVLQGMGVHHFVRKGANLRQQLMSLFDTLERAGEGRPHSAPDVGVSAPAPRRAPTPTQARAVLDASSAPPMVSSPDDDLGQVEVDRTLPSSILGRL